MKRPRIDALWALIGLNVGVWVVINVGLLCCRWWHGDSIVWLHTWQLPSQPLELWRHIWTPLTYMVSQSTFIHLIFNMLWLLGFGGILLRTQGKRPLLASYVISGLCGAVAFILLYTLWLSPTQCQWLMGSSGAVVGVAVSAALLNPTYRVNIAMIGRIRLWWLVALALLLIVMSGNVSIGGQAAHAGGAAGGAIYAAYALYMKKHRRLSRQPSRLTIEIPATPPYQRCQSPQEPERLPEDELDALLDKIRTSGYESLSRRERERLIDVSRRLK